MDKTQPIAIMKSVHKYRSDNFAEWIQKTLMHLVYCACLKSRIVLKTICSCGLETVPFSFAQVFLACVSHLSHRFNIANVSVGLTDPIRLMSARAILDGTSPVVRESDLRGLDTKDIILSVVME